MVVVRDTHEQPWCAVLALLIWIGLYREWECLAATTGHERRKRLREWMRKRRWEKRSGQWRLILVKAALTHQRRCKGRQLRRQVR